MNLFSIFHELACHFTTDKPTIDLLWNEIESKYSSKERHYHNLSHLEFMIRVLTPVKGLSEDWNTLLLSVFYHDIIYTVQQQDNEEKSAYLASNRLRTLSVPSHNITKCRKQIMATKDHQCQEDNDANLLIDADLAILGTPAEIYRQYAENIRREYSIYPDDMYRNGRRNVLIRFIKMKTIYKTPPFISAYEEQARNNLEYELAQI